MADSVLKDVQGPDWPLGLIVVPTPGTPVGIMSLVDSGNSFAPGTPSPANNGTPKPEYTVRAQQIMFQAVHSNNGNGTVPNAGNVYIVRQGSGPSNRSDFGAIVHVLTPGETFFLASAPQVKDVFGPYRYSLDSDSANDGALVTLLIF